MNCSRPWLLAAALVVPFSTTVAPTGACWITPNADGTQTVEVPYGTTTCTAPVPTNTASVIVDDPGVVDPPAVSAGPPRLQLTMLAGGNTVIRLLDATGAEIQEWQVTHDTLPTQQGQFSCAFASPPTC